VGIDVASFSSVVLTARDDTKSAWESVRAEARKTADDMRNFHSLVMGPFTAVQSAIAAIGAAFASVSVISFVNRIAESTAALQRMSEVTGASAASLSAIASAARLSSTDLGSVETAIVRMTKGMAGAEDQTKGFGGALAYLGLSARDSQGQMKPTEAMLLEIAQALEKYADGAGKTALAQALFGKAGAQMIPVLKDLAIIGEYNVKVTDEQARAAEEYEKNLKRLSAIKSELYAKIARELIPAFDDLTVVVIQAYKGTGGLRDELGNLVKDGSIKTWGDEAAMGLAQLADAFVRMGINVKIVYEQMKLSANSFNQAAALVGTQGIDNPIAQYFAKQIAINEAYIAKLKEEGQRANTHYADMLGRQQALRLGMDPGSWDSRDIRAQAGPKPQANPVLGGKDDAVANEAAYARIIRLVQEKTASLQQELFGEQKLTEANRLALDTMLKLQDGTLKATLAQKQKLAADLEAMLAAEAVLIRQKALQEAYIAQLSASMNVEQEVAVLLDAIQAKKDAGITTMQREIEQIQFETDLIGKTNEQRTIAVALRALEAAGIKKGTAEYDAMEASLRNAVAAQTKAIEASLKLTNSAKDAATAWRTAGADIADSAGKAFGPWGVALGGIVRAFADANAKKIELDDQYTKIANQNGGLTAAQAKTYQDQTAQNALSMYGDMAGAAASFFDKQSSAYKVLHGIEVAMHVAKLAMMIEAMVMDTTLTGSSVINSGVRAAADGVAAFAKTLASIAFPYNLAAGAAVLAALVAVGVRVGGGSSGGGQSAADIQKTQGTGTVLGDTTAKSASLENALKEIEKTDKLGLIVSHQMLASLRSIESALTGVAAQLVGGTSVTTGAGGNSETSFGAGALTPGGLGLGAWDLGYLGNQMVQRFDPAMRTAMSAIFRVTTTITDSGILFNDRLGQLAQGIGIMQYTLTNTTTRVLGIRVRDTPGQENTPLPASVTHSFGLIFKGITDSVEAAAKALHQWSPYFREAMNNIILTVDFASLNGLKGKDVQDALDAVLSAASDEVAKTMLPGFEEFAKIGEGYYQTVLRVATANEYVEQTFSAMGLTMPLLGMQAITANMNLVDLAGGLENFGKLTQDYMSKYYSPSEQHAITGQILGSEFASAGVNMPTDVAGFRAMVDGLSTSGALATEAGQELFAALMRLAPSFYEFATQVVGLDGKMHSLDEAMAQHLTLQQKYDVLRGAKTQEQIEYENALAAAITPANRALVEQIHTLEVTQAGKAAEAKADHAQFDLRKQLFDLSHSEAEVLAQNRSLKMQELADREKELNMAPGTLQAIQAQIDAQTDLNAVMLAAGNATLDAMKTQGDLSAQLFAMTHTQEEQLANTRAAKLLELQAQEALAGMAPGTLTSIYRQIIAQEDLSAASKAAEDTAKKAKEAFDALMQASGIGLAPLIKKGLLGEMAGADLGQAMADMVVNGVYNAMATGVADQVAGIIQNALITPIMTAILNGASVTAAINATLTQANINAMIAGATAAVNTLAAVFNDPAFKDAMASLRAAISGLGATMGGAAHATSSASAAAQRAAQAQTTAAQNLANATAAWRASLNDWLRSNALGDLSPLTAQQKLEEARRQYEADLILARGGDQGARDRLTREADAFLAAQKAVSAYGGDYSAIYARIRAEINALANPNGAAIDPGAVQISNNIVQLKGSVERQTAVVGRLLERLLERVGENTSAVTEAVTGAGDLQVRATNNAVALKARA
jgi:hypothetical protein